MFTESEREQIRKACEGCNFNTYHRESWNRLMDEAGAMALEKASKVLEDKGNRTGRAVFLGISDALKEMASSYRETTG